MCRLDPEQHATVTDAQNERVASEAAAAAVVEEVVAAGEGDDSDEGGHSLEETGRIAIFEDAPHSELRQRLAERISTLQSSRNASMTKKTSQQRVTASEKRKAYVFLGANKRSNQCRLERYARFPFSWYISYNISTYSFSTSRFSLFSTYLLVPYIETLRPKLAGSFILTPPFPTPRVKAEAKRKRETLRGQKVDHGQNGASSANGVEGEAGASAQVFSKFNFSTAPRVGKEKKRGNNNPIQLLAKAQAEKEKMAKLKSADPVKAEQKEKEVLWKKALLRAEGAKVKDDTKLLKKAIRRKDTKKKKTKEDWKERTVLVHKGSMKKQKKRDDNLHERASNKLFRKMNNGKKKQTVKPKKRPGFEGGPKEKKPKTKMTLQTGYKFKA